jgi:hypothetical protein
MIHVSYVSDAEAVNWLETRIKDTTSSVTSVVIGDADNDGTNEVLVGLWSPNSEVRMYKKTGGVWSENIIISVSESVYSLAIGDCDNDAKNEVVIGMLSTTDEVRAYEYSGGIWVEDIIADTPSHVYSLAVGDGDGDGKNDVIIGLANSLNEVRSYTKSGGVWIENVVYDVPANVRSVDVGDADNDGKPEVVIGMDSCTNEVRAYENVSGIWTEDIVADAPNNVYDIAIGDADNDGQNEVVSGLASSSNEIRAYEKIGASWIEDLIFDTPNDVWTCAIGDIDNDGKSEVVIGMRSTSFELRAYEKIDSVWSQELIRDLPQDIYSVAVGDTDSDGDNEVLVGMWSTTFEVRIYDYDIGGILFTSVQDGDYVQGTVCFEVAATSGSLEEVWFYIDDELKHADSQWPYQYLLDTTPLPEDAVYTVKAEGIISNVPPISTSVDVIINNVVQTGNYISVNALKSSYNPDQEVSVRISTSSPPACDALGMLVSYTDSAGNMKFSANDTVPYTTQYLVGLPIFSDASLGVYNISATVYGYHRGSLIWTSESQSTFTVSGYDVHTKLQDLNSTLAGMEVTLGDLQADLGGMSLADIRDNLDYLNQTLNYKVDGIYSDLAALNTSFDGRITNLENIISTMEWELAQTNSTLHEQLTLMDLYNSVFHSAMVDDFTSIYNTLSMVEFNLEIQHDSISGAIDGLNGTLADSPDLSTSEIMNGINTSMAQIATLKDNMTVHDDKIQLILSDLSSIVVNENNLTKFELLDNISSVLGELESLDTEMGSHDIAVKEDITDLSDIISNMESMNITELEYHISDLAISVSEHDSVIGQDIEGFAEWVADFKDTTEEKLTDINESLEDLEKLDSIIHDLNELDGTQEETEGKTQNSDDDQVFSLMMALIGLVILSVLLLLVTLHLFKENKGLRSTLVFGSQKPSHSQNRRWGQNKLL